MGLRHATYCCALFHLSSAADYFISSSNPASNDSNPGTSSAAPWRTLQRASAQSLVAGDSVSLLYGDIFSLHGNDSWTFTGLRGLPSLPITFLAYSDFSEPPLVRPLIAKAPMGSGPTITFDNCTGIWLTGLEVAGGEQGLAFTFDVDNSSPLPTVFQGFNISDVQIRDVHGLNPAPAAADWWGVAVAFAARHAGVLVQGVLLDRLAVSDSDTFYINDLQQPAGAWTRPYVSDLNVTRCSLTRMSFNTLFLDTTSDVLVQSNVFYKNTPASLFVAGTTDIIMGSVNASVRITGNEIGWRGEYQPGGPDGCAIDFETAADGTKLDGNYIHHSYGAGIMVFGHQTTSTNLVFQDNIMLSNGCGQSLNDKGGIAFMHVNSSGVIKGNIFTECPGNVPPVFNELQPGNMNGWDISNNVVDTSNGTVVVMSSPSFSWSQFNGTFVAQAVCTGCGSMWYSLSGRPTVGGADSMEWPIGGTLVLPPTGLGLWIKAFPPSQATRSFPAMDSVTYVESPAVGDVLTWSRG